LALAKLEPEYRFHTTLETRSTISSEGVLVEISRSWGMVIRIYRTENFRMNLRKNLMDRRRRRS